MPFPYMVIYQFTKTPCRRYLSISYSYLYIYICVICVIYPSTTASHIVLHNKRDKEVVYAYIALYTMPEPTRKRLVFHHHTHIGVYTPLYTSIHLYTPLYTAIHRYAVLSYYSHARKCSRGLYTRGIQRDR